ncbi:hypothetical protein [Psychrobacter vallis]|uniref:hypothetical protein n=1 Tax=Psychrobacter vallis TaxID=248451 RepID=UPI00191B1CD5|nr:hypothetical protein [Psychrobacter vallis]
MDNTDELIKLDVLFNKLKIILLQENEDNFIRGINSILNMIQFSLEYNENAKATIKSVGNTYFFMNSGNGSFSDFFIWREDFNERVEANKILTNLRNDITSLIASVDNHLLNSR